MFFASDLSGDIITLEEQEARHATGSRRLRSGETASVFDGRGNLAEGPLIVEGSGKRSVTRIEVRTRTSVPPPTTETHLFTAAPKGDRLRFLVEKCTELGVSGLHFVRWERSVVEPSSHEKLQRVAIEACKQSKRLWLPEIELDVEPSAFQQFAGQRLFADANGSQPSTESRHAIAIGPEGGFSDAERNQLNASAAPLRLGPHILRTETAGMAACSWGAGVSE